MIVDLELWRDAETIDCDVCLIGGGPSGLTTALELMGSGLKVVVLEAGGATETQESIDLYRGESVGHPVRPHEGRHRVFGGSSLTWGGRCAMYDPIDFEVRDWVPDSGWPISFADLRPYYERAKVVSNFDIPWASTEEVERALGFALPKLTEGTIETFIWRHASRDRQVSWKTLTSLGFSRRMNWAHAYRREFETDPNTTVVLNAAVTAFYCAEDGAAVTAVRARTRDGHSIQVKARCFILAASGIENPRLLLNTPAAMKARFNKYDICGRYFSQHPRGVVNTIRGTPAQLKRLQNTYNNFFYSPRVRITYESGFALSEHAQRKHKLLNASGGFYHDAPENGAWKAGKRIRDALAQRSINGSTASDLMRLATGLFEEAPNALRKYVTSTSLRFREPISTIKIDLEQTPDPNSRLSLSDQVDAIGLPQVRIDWRIGELERRTARHFAYGAKAELERLGFGDVEVAPWVESDAPILEENLRGNYHFIGATRMADTAQKGVVDANCKVHGVDNLYVAGCSVFSTGGHANPNLTIVALAIRLADEVRARYSDKAAKPLRSPEAQTDEVSSS